MCSGRRRPLEAAQSVFAGKQEVAVLSKTADQHQTNRSPDAFADRFPFHDEVHGEIFVNAMERDIIDTPEFQRLFRISQLGFVDLAFATANHTRAVHSIGTCYLT